MGKNEDFKNQFDHGDHSLIAEMFADRHMIGDNPDYKTVSTMYVGMVISGKRPATKGTAAAEILLIAKKYLKHKKELRNQILAL